MVACQPSKLKGRGQYPHGAPNYRGSSMGTEHWGLEVFRLCFIGVSAALLTGFIGNLFYCRHCHRIRRLVDLYNVTEVQPYARNSTIVEDGFICKSCLVAKRLREEEPSEEEPSEENHYPNGAVRRAPSSALLIGMKRKRK